MALEFTRLVNGTKLDEIQGQVDDLDSRVSINETDISEIKTQLDNLPSGGGGVNVTVEKYTSVTELLNKALELVRNNRFCFIKMNELKNKTVTTTQYKVDSSGFTSAEVSFSMLISGSQKYLYPSTGSNSGDSITFSSGDYKISLSPSLGKYYYSTSTHNSNGFAHASANEHLYVLINEGYITINLCYI